MKLVETEDGYVPVERIARIYNVEGNRAVVEWFDGYAIRVTGAKVQRRLANNPRDCGLVLFASGADLKVVLPKSTRDELIASGEVGLV